VKQVWLSIGGGPEIPREPEFPFSAFVLARRSATAGKREDGLRENHGFLLSSSPQIVGGQTSFLGHPRKWLAGIHPEKPKMDSRYKLSGMTVRSIPVTMEIK